MSKSVIAVSAIVGSMAALSTYLVFFYFVCKPSQSVDAKLTATPTQQNAPTPVAEIPNPEIKGADVTSVSINTVYKGYFDPGNKCAKTYNEYFGDEDGFASSSSPCTIKMTVNRDGRATRSVDIGRWDKAAKQKRIVEKTDTTAAITTDQFNLLAQMIVANEAFKSWRDGTMINVSNCSITVTHSGGVKAVMSNVGDSATAYLPMVEAFKKLEKELRWETVQ